VVRRLIAVGLGVLLLIVFVLLFRGCLEARSDRGLRNYTQDVAGIMAASEQSGREFFEAFDNAEGFSEDDVKTKILSVRNSNSNLLDRAEKVDAPDEMRDGHTAVKLALTLRADAMERIGDNIGQAAADTETSDPVDAITQQMGSLYASDILWSQLGRPEVQSVLDEEGVDASELPAGLFMPETDPTKYLEQPYIAELVGGVSGDESEETTGTRGVELVQTSMGGGALDPDTTVTVPSDAREVTVQVMNGGEVDESAVTVIVSLNGGEDIEKAIPSIAVGATEEVNINLGTLPQPGTEATLEVLVEPVDGELDSSNNESQYTIIFGTS
jgi:hypothetical protein